MRTLLIFLSTLLIVSCSQLRPEHEFSDGHLQPSDETPSFIPDIVKQQPVLPPPQPEIIESTHTVVVSDVPVKELLFAIAREADLNVDIDQNINETITLNAIDQPLSSILTRISELASLRYSINDQVLSIKKDVPYLKNYVIDYLNMTRSSKSTTSVSTQISATGQGAGQESSGDENNNSKTEVNNSSDNNFWDTLANNIAAIIGDTITDEKGSPNIIINKESGIAAVRATERQHAEVQKFIDEVQNSTQRQVLIEATIAEVKLSDRYQAGIDWSLLQEQAGSGVDITQSVTDTNLISNPAISLILTDTNVGSNILQATLRSLETFGDVSVMSSPKVMAMNNQTALLKVVDNLVYFTVEVTVDNGETGQAPITTYETSVNTVPVGFVMSVTPYINQYGSVTLNVRPTISRVIDQRQDPNPDLARFNVVSEIPVIQVREVESVLKINNGDIAVIGGLMQDEISKNSSGIPILSKVPMLGSLFRYDNDQSDKTELVIFIKPVVISNPNNMNQISNYQRLLPKLSQPK